MKAYLFLATGFEEMEAMYPLSVLRTAEFEIISVSVTGSKNVLSSHGVTVIADAVYDDLDLFDADIIILPGGQPGTENLTTFDPLKEIVKYYVENRAVAAICAAPSILGRMGLLKGRAAICYPGYESKLIGAHISNSKVVIDGNIITAAGPGVAKEFAFAIVKHIGGNSNYNKIYQIFK